MSVKHWYKTFGITVWLFTTLHSLHAQQTIGTGKIEGTGTGQISIQLPAFKGGGLSQEVTQILNSDLTRSGLFRIVSAGGQYSVDGLVNQGGGINIEARVHDVTSKQQVFGRKYSAAGQAQVRTTVHKLSDDIVAALTGRPGIAQTKIAFMATSTGKDWDRDLYVMDYDGNGVQKLTNDRKIMARPRWSKDNRKISYLMYRPWPDSYVHDLSGGKRIRLTSAPGLNSGATISPNGDQVVLTMSKDGNPDLYLIPVGGGSPSRLLKTKGADSSPSWSPDGSQIVFTSDMSGTPQLYVISANGGTPRRLTTQGSYNTEPDWSPDGKTIAYTTREGRDFQIAILDVENPQNTRTLTRDAAYNMDPTWAPDSRHILFMKKRGDQAQLYVLDAVTLATVQISPKNLGQCSDGAWSK